MISIEPLNNNKTGGREERREKGDENDGDGKII